MKKNIIVQISEGLGNQLFMYAHAYALSKKFDRNLLIDNTSGYYKEKNLLRPHQKYMLDFFNISNDFAPINLKFDTLSKNILKKFLIFVDNFKENKSFLNESYKRINNKKLVFNLNFNDIKPDKNLYVSGNFENENFFDQYKKDLINFFSPQVKFINNNLSIISELKNTNSISVHIRRNRFCDQKGLINSENKVKSDIFTTQIINYINRSINYINKNVKNPKYFIWSNDFTNFEEISNKLNVDDFKLVKNNDPINDFYLFKFAKHFIVGPSSYHWWGAWLNESKNKYCLRPSDINPSNNSKFWPDNWVSI